MKKSIALIAITCLSVPAFSSQTFKLTVTNTGPQGLSPLFWSTSDASFDIFQLGGTSSLGIKNIAEGGNTAAMMDIAGAAGSSVSGFGTVAGGPVAPGGSRVAYFTTDEAHSYFSFASMLGRTNDGFLGEGVSSEGLMLFSGGMAQGFTYDVFGTNVWDAGTEENTQNAADLGFLMGSGNPADSNSMIRVHGGILNGVGDSFALMPNWTAGTQIARIQVEPVPEPATIAAMALGVGAFLRKRRK